MERPPARLGPRTLTALRAIAAEAARGRAGCDHQALLLGRPPGGSWAAAGLRSDGARCAQVLLRAGDRGEAARRLQGQHCPGIEIGEAWVAGRRLKQVCRAT